MNAFLCQLDLVVVWLIRVYFFILLIYAVLSWIPDIRGPWIKYIAMLVEPVLNPIRRVVPAVGGLDLSFLVVIIVLNWVILPLVARAAAGACFSY